MGPSCNLLAVQSSSSSVTLVTCPKQCLPVAHVVPLVRLSLACGLLIHLRKGLRLHLGVRLPAPSLSPPSLSLSPLHLVSLVYLCHPRRPAPSLSPVSIRSAPPGGAAMRAREAACQETHSVQSQK